MFNPFRDYFYYTQNERNGTIGLVCIAFFFFIAPAFYSFVFPVEAADYISYDKELPDVQPYFVDVSPQDSDNIAPKDKALITPLLFNFDPNTISEADLNKLGLNSKTAKTIIKYRNKGGKFYKVTDFQKIYTLSDAEFHRLKSYIKIAPIERRAPTRRDTGGLEVPEEYAVNPIKLFAFDPNEIAANEFLKLGLSHDVVNNILRYRAKGGKFYAAESLKKIYGLSARDYQRIEPYVTISPSVYPQTTVAAKQKKYVRNDPNVIIDINQATAEEWQQLYGVGDYLAKKIVNYRNYLGGFSSIEQVAETYGVRPETFERISPQLKFSPVLRTIKINIATTEELKKHPYINWTQAQTIYNFRKQHSNYQTAADLLKTGIISIEESKKLEPYLDFSTSKVAEK